MANNKIISEHISLLKKGKLFSHYDDIISIYEEITSRTEKLRIRMFKLFSHYDDISIPDETPSKLTSLQPLLSDPAPQDLTTKDLKI